MTGSTGRQTNNQIVTQLIESLMTDQLLNNNDRDEWEPTQTTQFTFSQTNKIKYVKSYAATIPGQTDDCSKLELLLSPNLKEKKSNAIRAFKPLKDLHQSWYFSNNHQYMSFATVEGW